MFNLKRSNERFENVHSKDPRLHDKYALSSVLRNIFEPAAEGKAGPVVCAKTRHDRQTVTTVQNDLASSLAYAQKAVFHGSADKISIGCRRILASSR